MKSELNTKLGKFERNYRNGLRKALLSGVVLLGLSFLAHSAEQSQAKPQPDKIPPYQIKQIEPGVWAALKPAPHRIVDSNIVIVESNKCLTIVDANDNLSNARQLTQDIKKLSDKPVCYVINTHWHSDHIFANAVYKKAFPTIRHFVGHVSLPKLIETKAKPQLAEKIGQWENAIKAAKQRVADGIGEPQLEKKIANAEIQLADLRATKLITPTLMVEQKLALPVEGIKVELLNFGKGHTEGDLVVYLPEKKLLLSGDLFDHLPYAGHGYPSEWLHTLKSIGKLSFETVIPGHGAVQQGKETLHRIQWLIEESLSLANKAVAKDQSKKAFMESVKIAQYHQKFAPLDELGERAYKQFIPEFFERAYLEASGQLADRQENNQ